MGSGNSSYITINLDRTNPFFFGGETVSGTVNLYIRDECIRVKEIFIKLEGQTGYATERDVRQSDGSTRTETVYHSVPFFNAKKILGTPQMGQKEMIYYAGQYSWRYEFVLPFQIPPSMNQPESCPRVRYLLEFVINKPWYRKDDNQILYLTVFPHINLSHNPQLSMRSTFGNHNRKGVHLKGNINKHGYLPGESITGTVEIENPRRVKLKRIHVYLYQHYKIHSNSKKEILSEILIPNIINRNDEWMVEQFLLMIPDMPLPPSYLYNGGSPRTAYAEIVYFLEFDVKAEGLFTNFDVNVPITIGTECNTNHPEYQLHQSNNLHPNSLTNYPEITINTDEDSPPSYHSIVN